MQLTASNYYSREANEAFFSASQIKSFMRCPARTMAELRGEYTPEASKSLLVGSFVDAYFEGTLGEFRENNSALFTKTGKLRAEFERAAEMCERAEQDDLFMCFLAGKRQAILTGDIMGFPFKCKLDFYVPDVQIVDLKTVRDFAPQYKPGAGRVSFIEAWDYDLQMAIYQEIEGHGLPCFIAAITKEATPDIAVIRVPQHYMDSSMAVLRENLSYFDAIKRGDVDAPRCEKCDYCKSTKVLSAVQSIEDFEEEYSVE